MNDVQIAFEELFFGSGSWLGLLLLLSIIIALSLKAKYAGLLMIPVTIFLGIDYLSESMMWNAIIMFLSNIFIVFMVMKKD